VSANHLPEVDEHIPHIVGLMEPAVGPQRLRRRKIHGGGSTFPARRIAARSAHNDMRSLDRLWSKTRSTTIAPHCNAKSTPTAGELLRRK
jgi:hypothetical protein